MAEPQPAATDSPLLRGLFGVLQTGAQEHQSTADIWTSLRTAAGSWQFQAQGVAQPYDPAAVEAAGREILRAQGIDAAAVSTFRGVAGQWLGAKTSLANRDPAAQIVASDIFVAPWSTTAMSAAPSRYRIRTQWQVEPAAGDVFTKWKADEITGPITSLDDVLAQAAPDANTTSGQQILGGQTAPVLLDYEIEQI